MVLRSGGTSRRLCVSGRAVPLDHEAKDRDVKNDSKGADGVIVFTSAFFALLILAVTYAVLSGRTATGTSVGIAAHEQQLNGGAFGLAALLMLVGLHEVLRIYGGNSCIFEPGRNLIVRATGLYGPIIVIAFQFSNALDTEAYRATTGGQTTATCFAGVSIGVWINLAISLVAIAALIVLAAIGRRLATRRGAAAMVGRATLGFTIAITVWTAMVVPFLPLELVTSATLEHLTLAATATGSVAFGAAAWLSR